MLSMYLTFYYERDRTLKPDEVQTIAQQLFSAAQNTAELQTYMISLTCSDWGHHLVNGRFASCEQSETGSIVTCYQVHKVSLKKKDSQLCEERDSDTGTDLQQGMHKYVDFVRSFTHQGQKPSNIYRCVVKLQWQVAAEDFSTIKEMATQLPVPSEDSYLHLYSYAGSVMFDKFNTEGHPLVTRADAWVVYSRYKRSSYYQSFPTLTEAIEFVRPQLHLWDQNDNDDLIMEVKDFVKRKLRKVPKVK